MDEPKMPPLETQNDWLRFIRDRELTLMEVGDWIELRAAEIGWDVFELICALTVGVEKPRILRPKEAKERPS